MKKILFLIPLTLLFTGCNGLYIVPIPINTTSYSTTSYYTPSNEYYYVNGEYILLPIRQYKYRYNNGIRMVFINNLYRPIYSHSYYTKHRKYKKTRKINNRRYNKNYYHDTRKNNKRYDTRY